MPNYNKSFNFRNGVQVDESNFYVNAYGLVGIGTTIPRYTFDLRGDAAISGLTTTKSLNVTGVATFNQISVGSSIGLYASSGIISAAKFYGDGSTLTNIPTSQWVDVDPTAAYASIYSKGIVGIATTNPKLPYVFTVGQNPDTVDINVIPSGGVGFSSYGQINATGIVTAGKFSGLGDGITNINASNISSGTLNNSRLPSQINLTTGIATIRNIVVSSGATIGGITTFNSQGLTSKNITAVAFTGGTFYTTSIVEIANTGLLKFSGGSGVSIGNDTGYNGQFLVSNGSNGILWSSSISLTGVATVGLLSAKNIFNTGVTTTSSLQVDTTATINNLSVNKIISTTPTATNEITRINSGIVTTSVFKSSFSETGVTTSTSLNTGDLKATGIGTIQKLYTGNIKLNDNLNTIETISGDLKLDANSSLVNVSNNLKVTGQSYLSGLSTVNTGLVAENNAYLGSATKRFGEAYIDDVKIGATASNVIDTVGNNLVLGAFTGTVNVNSNLGVINNKSFSVTGQTYLTGLTTVYTGIVPENNAYLGNSTKRFSEAYIDDVKIGATASNVIDTVGNNLVLDAFTGTVEVSNNLKVNKDLNVSGQSYLSGLSTVATGLIPENNAYLGSVTQRFSQAYVNDVKIGSTQSNVIDTVSNNLILGSATGTVNVDSNLSIINSKSLSVAGQSYLTGITTVSNGLVPANDNESFLGSATQRFNQAYINQVQIGTLNASGIISTRSGDLSLDSFTKKVSVDKDLIVNRNLSVSGISTITGNLIIGSSFLPLVNNDSSIGSATLRFSQAYVNDVKIGSTASNVIDTVNNNLVLGSATGTVNVDSNLRIINSKSLYVTGPSYLTGITTLANSLLPYQNNQVPLGSATLRFSEAYVDDIKIGSTASNVIDTVNNNLVLGSATGTVNVDSNLSIINSKSLSVAGQSYLTGITTVANDFLPNTDGGSSLGATNRSFAALHVANLNFGVSSNQINTRSGNLNLSSFNNVVTVQDNLTVNNRLYVSGISTLAGVCQVNEGLLPDENLGAYLGTGSTSFANAHIGNINLANGESNTISTKSGDLKLNSNTNIARVLNKLIVDGRTELTGIASVSTGLIPVTDRSSYLGLANQAFNYAYINNIRVAVANTSTIDTISGDLTLQSASDTVVVNDKLSVLGNLTVQNNIFGGVIYADNTNNKVGFGTTAPFAKMDLVTNGESASFLIKSLDPTNSSSLSLSSGSDTASLEFNLAQSKNLVIKNQTTGSIIQQLHSVGSGINTGYHQWRYKDNELMTLTYQGKLGVGNTNPVETFGVVGTSTVTSNSFVGGNLNVVGNLNLLGSLNYTFPSNQQFNVGIVTANNLIGLTSITSNNNLYVQGSSFTTQIKSFIPGNNISIPDNVNLSGIVTFTNQIINKSDVTFLSDRTLKMYSGEQSGAGTASTITASLIQIDRVETSFSQANQFNGNKLNVLGIATVGHLNIPTGGINLSFGGLNVTGVTTLSSQLNLSSTLRMTGTGTSIFVGSEQSSVGDLFVGVGVSYKITNTNLYVRDTIVSENLVVGIGTTVLNNNPEIVGVGLAVVNKEVYCKKSNIVMTYGSSLSFDDGVSGYVNSINDSYGNLMIYLGTGQTLPKAVVDFRNAGTGITINPNNTVFDGSKIRFMLPPVVSDSERVGLTTVAGAMIFNSSVNKHQCYDGTAWRNLY